MHGKHECRNVIWAHRMLIMSGKITSWGRISKGQKLKSVLARTHAFIMCTNVILQAQGSGERAPNLSYGQLFDHFWKWGKHPKFPLFWNTALNSKTGIKIPQYQTHFSFTMLPVPKPKHLSAFDRQKHKSLICMSRNDLSSKHSA